MSNTKEVFENIRIQKLEMQVEQLTLQLQDYHLVKEQLAQAQKRETLASLSGGIAHDFNNILHCILGCTEFALSGKKNGSTDFEIFKQIQELVKRGEDLAQRFLVFGRKSIHRQVSLNFNTIVEDVECLLSRTMPPNIKLEHKLDSKLAFINGDVGQCEQIVMNLCINAMDAMPSGGELVIKTRNINFTPISQVHMKQGITPGSFVHISISDSGTGMSEDVLENIFEPFFTTKEKGRGSGLGLSVVSSIVKSHGGFIDCTSIAGSGSTFNIYLPAVITDCLVQTAREDKYPLDNSRCEEVILFIEDEEAIIRISKHFLERSGYSVLTAGSCEKGLEIYQKKTVDLVIMDVGLPGMGSIELLKSLQSINPGVKVLAISGYPAYSEAVRALGLEEQDFLQKPFSCEELMSRVRAILDCNTIPIAQQIGEKDTL